jgi:hypothetical protein
MNTFDTNFDPYGGSLDPPMSRSAAENYIRERVTTLLHKANSRSTEIAKLLREMAAHDGPPTKEEIEKHIRLKYGPDDDGMTKARRGLHDCDAAFAASIDGADLRDSSGL